MLENATPRDVCQSFDTCKIVYKKITFCMTRSFVDTCTSKDTCSQLFFSGYAADNITHCIRPQDTPHRRAVIILRKYVAKKILKQV